MSLRHAILGFLSLRPMSGYDLKKAFDESVGHFWTADQAQIYRALARLVDDGHVEVRTIEQTGRPDRREHRITEAGLRELDGWLTAAAEPRPMREPFLLKIFFAGRLAPHDLKAVLTRHVDTERRRLETLTGLADGLGRLLAGRDIDLPQRLRLATLDNGIRHTRTEIEWADALLEQIDPPSRPDR